MSQITEQTPANNLMLTTIGQLVMEMVQNGANFVKIDLSDGEGSQPNLSIAIALEETAPEFSKLAGGYQDALGSPVVSGTMPGPNQVQAAAEAGEPIPEPEVTVRNYEPPTDEEVV